MIDKKTKEFSLNGQHITADENNKHTKYDKVQYDSSGLSLRTRTISSTTVPTPLHHSTVSASNSVQSKCSSISVTPRPRGRPPRRKNLNRIANRKALQQATSKLSEKSKVCNLTTSITTVESAAVGLERLQQQQQQQQMNECNGIDNYDDDQENSEKNGTYINTRKTHSVLYTEVDEDCIIVDIACKKKSNNRKRKQSDIGESVAEKRLLKSNDSKDLLVKKNVIQKSLLPEKSNSELVKYGFLAGSNIFEPYRKCSDFKSYSSDCPSNFYGRTYWPTNWEYSAASLTGHVQKKTSKEALRKIRLICGTGATSKTNGSTVSTSLKTNLTLKKYQTSVLQRRGSACKSTTVAPVEVSGSLRHHPSTSTTIVKRQKGRPPGRKNKLLQAVLKSNSPRKSPRQHASTLAAIMSIKDENTDKVGNQQPDQLDADVESNRNSLDMDVPCLLNMAIPSYEHKSGFRHHRHRRQLENIHIIKRRRRRRRSITPPPPKLCAQQPAPQRISINTAIDQERVKLRTKHVDVVRRRARDERLRAAFVCQQLHNIQEIAEQNRHDIDVEENEQNYQFSNNAIILPFESNQDQIWSQITDSNREPDNMCLQIMYEQTADKRFLCTNLTDATLQMYYQQRELALNERLTNNCYGETMSSDLGADMISASNKRKKKRPNMTGWPKEKRRKIIATTSSMNIAVEDFNGDSDAEKDDIAKRRRAAAAEQQRLRRQRIKLEQQQLLKAKSKVKGRGASPKRRGRRPGRPRRHPGPIKKNKTTTHRRNNSVSSNGTTASGNTSSATNTSVKEKKLKKPRKQRTPVQNQTAVAVSVTPNTIVKRRCGRPVGSVGRRQRLKLEMLQKQHCQNQTSSSSEQQKENVVQQQSSTGKLKCVISTRNNRMKLLSTSSKSSSATLSQKKTMAVSKNKKSGAAYNLTSSCLASLPSQVTVVGKITRTGKRRRLQQHQQTATTTVTWDVGRPKRYHSTNHSRNANVVVEEDCCFVGSQPFEQHCPGGGGGLSHNSVIENHHDHQKENTVHSGL